MLPHFPPCIVALRNVFGQTASDVAAIAGFTDAANLLGAYHHQVRDQCPSTHSERDRKAMKDGSEGSHADVAVHVHPRGESGKEVLEDL